MCSVSKKAGKIYFALAILYKNNKNVTFLAFFSLVYTVLQFLISAGSLFSCIILFEVALRSTRRGRLSEARFKNFFARQRLAALWLCVEFIRKNAEYGRVVGENEVQS